jgi:hypothetical protein
MKARAAGLAKAEPCPCEAIMARASFEPELDLVHWRDGQEPHGRFFQQVRHIEGAEIRGAELPRRKTLVPQTNGFPHSFET